MRSELHSVMKDGVPCVCTSVIADDVRVLVFLAQKMGYFALARIPVLQINDDI